MSIEDPKSVTLTRLQLYEQVWTTPMRTLAARYGLSDVGLAKICDKYDVPRPPRGYWAQKQYGTAAPPPRLPSNVGPSMQTIVLHDGPRAVPLAKPPAPPPIYDDDIMAMLAKAEAMSKVVVPASLNNPHPLIAKTKADLVDQKPDQDGIVASRRYGKNPGVYVSTAKPNLFRALRFLDTLLKAIEKLGGKVSIETFSWCPPKANVHFRGLKVAELRLRERYKMKKPEPSVGDRWSWRTSTKAMTGRFVLDGGSRSFDKPLCEDSEKTGSRIEDEINRLLVNWVHKAGRARIAKHQADEKRRICEEQERLRLEREAELKRRRDELQGKQKIEQAKVDRLFAEAAAWQRSKMLRQYLEEIEGRSNVNDFADFSDGDFQKWLYWALEQADRLDPLAVSPPSILDERIDGT